MTDPIGTGPLRQQLGRRRFMVAVAGGLLAVPLSVEAPLSVALFHTESQRSVLFMVSRYVLFPVASVGACICRTFSSGSPEKTSG